MYPEKNKKFFPVFHVKHHNRRGRRGKKRDRSAGAAFRSPIPAKQLKQDGQTQIRIMPSSGGTEICR